MGEIFMPKMGDAMTEGKVVRWYKKVGDAVTKGEPVLEIETDKVNLDLEAEEDGVIESVAAEEGAMVQVGVTLAIVGSGKGAAPSAKPAAKPTTDEQKKTAETQKVPAATAKKTETAQPAQPVSESTQSSPVAVVEAQTAETQVAHEPAKTSSTDGRPPRSSPLARRIARELGVDLSGLQGSGPSGRIVASDVNAAEKNKPSQAGTSSSKPGQPTERQETKKSSIPAAVKLESKDVPLTAMRRTIAKRLSESIGPIPHFFLTVDYDVTNLLQLRAQLSEIDGNKVSVNDFFVRAVALALRHHPGVNASFTPEAIRMHGNVHVAVAVATPDGLITPVVKDTDSKSVSQIANEIRSLAERARARKLTPDEYQGSTITISNLGMYGIEEFTAIINPPNSAILAVGAAEPRAVVVDRQVVIRDRMKVTMSCDHRVIDGAAGADFLKTLRTYVEQPVRLIL